MSAQPSIVCPACGMRSHHPEDVARRYCGNCHAWHDDLLSGRATPGLLRPTSELNAVRWELRGAARLRLHGRDRR